MRLIYTCWAVGLIAWATTASPSYAQMECKCHSKQPAMKHMHEVIGFTGCGNCHTKDENLMSGQVKKSPGSRADLAKRKKEDRYCVPCHNSDGSVKTGSQTATKARNISGTFYCPKDKLQFPPGTKACPKCGGGLINIAALMEKSRVSPSNGICIQCHTMGEVSQIKGHALVNEANLKKCLDCHQGHGNCGSCHH